MINSLNLQNYFIIEKTPLLFFRFFYLSRKLLNLSLPFDVWKSLKSSEHSNGANKPVIKTWEKIFLIPGK